SGKGTRTLELTSWDSALTQRWTQTVPDAYAVGNVVISSRGLAVLDLNLPGDKGIMLPDAEVRWYGDGGKEVGHYRFTVSQDDHSFDNLSPAGVTLTGGSFVEAGGAYYLARAKDAVYRINSDFTLGWKKAFGKDLFAQPFPLPDGSI